MFLPSKATGCARMQEDSLEHAALSLLRGVSQGDARRRACPRMPASTANVYPSRTRALGHAKTGNTRGPFAGLLSKPSDGLKPSTPSLP